MTGSGNTCTFLRGFAGDSVIPYHMPLLTADSSPSCPTGFQSVKAVGEERREQYRVEVLLEAQLLRQQKYPEQVQEDGGEKEVSCILKIIFSKIQLDANLLV